ncbi:hypothetical protein HDU77_008237 [Chytriomyces hyalinus]|nr:hypothetical protein HDU77_008237 [Chytriomyces hyalinus]
MPVEWHFPVWTLAELEECHLKCYSTIPIQQVRERYGFCGGVPQIVFDPNTATNIPARIVAALADVNALEAFNWFACPARISPNSHNLMHMLVETSEVERPFQFQGLDLASRYIGEKLLERHPAQMMPLVQEMLARQRHLISPHLFELYGQHVFSMGGKELKCLNFRTGKLSKLVLDSFDGKRIQLTDASVLAKPILQYYQVSCDDCLPGIDSLNPQGMFKFSVDFVDPMQEIQVSKDLCALYDKAKLHVVVPPRLFASFVRLTKPVGQCKVVEVDELDWFVLELPVKQDQKM